MTVETAATDVVLGKEEGIIRTKDATTEEEDATTTTTGVESQEGTDLPQETVSTVKALDTGPTSAPNRAKNEENSAETTGGTTEETTEEKKSVTSVQGAMTEVRETAVPDTRYYPMNA